MNANKNAETIKCPECGWDFPKELLQNLLKGQVVYCERCGSEAKASDFNEADLRNNLKELVSKSITVVRKKSGKALLKIRDKLREAFNKQG